MPNEPWESVPVGSGTSTSRSLLARVRDNESDAWDRLVLLYTPLVYHWCRKLELPAQDIADVVQEVFQSVATHMKTFRKDRPGDTFRGWLRAITRSKVMDHYRRQSKQPGAVGGDSAHQRLAQLAEESDLAEPEEEKVRNDLFHRALEMVRGEFHERTWKAFWRVAVDGQPAKDVAEELSMHAGAVRVAKCRVLQRLRQELGELLE